MITEARFDELDTATLYAILQLRTDVFVVEQDCAYPELDGRDSEPETRHVWIPGASNTESTRIAAYLRVLVDIDAPRTLRIGRVVTHAEHRGRGLAAQLVSHVTGFDFDELVLDAQSHLTDWYEALGFSSAGPEYIEDGIAHVPMRFSATSD